jgi:hypothetical protein
MRLDLVKNSFFSAALVLCFRSSLVFLQWLKEEGSIVFALPI